MSQTNTAAGQAAGAALVENCPIVLAQDFNLPIGKMSECPFPTSDAVVGIHWWGYFLKLTEDKATFAKLDGEPGSYESCRKNTRYVKQIQAPAAGDVICYVSKGIVAAITFTKTIATGQYTDPAEFNITIWQA